MGCKRRVTYGAHIHFRGKMRHVESRTKVCLGCFCKCTQNLTSAQPLTQEFTRIHEHIVEHIDVDDFRLPNGWCEGCRLRLKKIDESEGKPFDLSHLHFYLETQKRISPREQAPCQCIVCQIASATGTKPKKLLRDFLISAGQLSDKPKEKIHKLCGKCHSPLYRGCTHSCNKSTLVENVLKTCPEGVLDSQSPMSLF